MEAKKIITREDIQKRRKARRRRRLIKYIAPRLAIALLFTLVVVLIVCFSSGTKSSGANESTSTIQTEGTEATPINTAAPVVSYALTPEERELIEQVVAAESRGEPITGQVAVAQCILNACLKENIRPAEAIAKYQYTKNRAEATDSVKEAVTAVFDRGEGVTKEPILYFYNPAAVSSEFHESQIFVIEIKNHRFFKEAE